MTDCLSRVIEQARTEAQALNQQFITTEHLALALLKSHGSLALRAMRAAHVDCDAVRSDLLAVMPYSETPLVTETIPMSNKAQRTLNSALVMSRSLRESKVSTRVLMLALLDDPAAPLVRALRETGANVEELIRALAEKPAQAEA